MAQHSTPAPPIPLAGVRRWVGSVAKAGYGRAQGGAVKLVDAARDSARWGAAKTAETAGVIPAFLAQSDLLRWSESITKSGASIYDKALDAEFLRTRVGGQEAQTLAERSPAARSLSKETQRPIHELLRAGSRGLAFQAFGARDESAGSPRKAV